MNVIYGLLAISILVALVFFGLFIFSVKKGQFDDDYTPSVRMLFDDELVKDKDEEKNENSNNQQKQS
ncbi:cbb3-type cytochrome oxidase assembly protein CcoS [Psychroflexus salinarum]|uniref:Cbb3-type cytochrome oxidase assembly protein CcoS n=1 Tax=Psychroflexus salinarum TaxID=546024 RepID=A0ABW3GL67_9FLAO